MHVKFFIFSKQNSKLAPNFSNFQNPIKCPSQLTHASEKKVFVFATHKFSSAELKLTAQAFFSSTPETKWKWSVPKFLLHFWFNFILTLPLGQTHSSLSSFFLFPFPFLLLRFFFLCFSLFLILGRQPSLHIKHFLGIMKLPQNYLILNMTPPHQLYVRNAQISLLSYMQTQKLSFLSFSLPIKLLKTNRSPLT